MCRTDPPGAAPGCGYAVALSTPLPTDGAPAPCSSMVGSANNDGVVGDGTAGVDIAVELAIMALMFMIDRRDDSLHTA